MLPPVIEDYVALDAPVRIYDAFVDSLDFNALGISLQPNPHGGQDEYYPKDIMKLIIFGYSYGIRSSRKLERACYDNLSFIWLMGGLKPDFCTIARFRHTYKEAIRRVLKQCVHLCIKLDLISSNMLFIDGSKFRANASINNTWTKEKCQKSLKKLEEYIDHLVDETENIDTQEQDNDTLVKTKEKIQDKAKLMNKIKDVMADLEISKQKSLNSTDPDCVNAKSRQGTHASYNVQSVVDSKHGLIVHTEAVPHAVDLNQLSRQIEQATAVLEKKPEHVCADCGYSSIEDIKDIDADINIVVPSHKQAQENNGRHPLPAFGKERFTYDAARDEYVCPENQRLSYRRDRSDRAQKYYHCNKLICRNCPNFGDPRQGKCTQSLRGREITRMHQQDLQDRLEKNYKKPENQSIYALRKQMVEHPFGHMKRNLGAGQFMLRGKANVNAEASLLSTCFNISRLTTIVGALALINTLKGI
jgi:transposase